jgi:hypothetical protein
MSMWHIPPSGSPDQGYKLVNVLGPAGELN